MASKTTKKIVIALLLLLSLLVGATLYAHWYVTSGRLRALVEKRVGEAVNANVHMDSLLPAWPPRIEIEGLIVSAPGHEDAPLLTCPSITIKGSARELIRGRVGSITLVSPIISISMSEGKGSNIPAFPTGGPEGGQGGAASFGSVKIVDARIDLDLPNVSASSRGVTAGVSVRQTPSGVEEVVKLDVDAVDVSIARDGGDPIPIGLKVIRSKFVRRVGSPGSEIEGEVNAGLGASVPYLRLPSNIPIRLLFEFDHFPERDSLENGIFTLSLLPSIRLHAYGSITGLTSGDPSPDLNVNVSPVEAPVLVEYVEPLQRPIFEEMKISGKISAGATLSGALSDPEVYVRMSAEQGRVEWNGFLFEGLEVEAPLALGDGPIRIEACRLSADKAVAPVGGENFFFEATSLSGIVSGDPARITIKEGSARLGNVGEVVFEAAYEPGSGHISANARMADASGSDALAYAAPMIGALPDEVSMSGRVNLKLDAEAVMDSKIEKVEVGYRVSLSEGEFTSGELVAVAGVDAGLEGSARMESAGGPWKFNASGHAGGFELLVDTFYKDFSGDHFPFSFSGEYAPEDSGRLRIAEVLLDLGLVGKIRAAGEMRNNTSAGAALKLKTERIDLAKLHEWFGAELLAEMAPDLNVVSVGGIVSGNLDLGCAGKQWNVGGRLKLDDGRIALDGGALEVESLVVDLPFNVHFPQGEQEGGIENGGPVEFSPGDYGNVKIGALGVGPVIITSLDLKVALKENSLSVRGPTTIEIFGGSVEIGEIRGESLFGSDAAASMSLTARAVSLEEIAEAFGLPEIVGALEADFPEIIITSETLLAEGAVRAEAFGGSVDVTSLEVDRPLSSVRTFMADIKAREIDLSALTQTLGFGSISGIMEGTLTGFEMSQGQPAAFVADFQTVKRRGARQRINIDAVENITILGTGQGFQMGLGRGLAAFFDEFGYDTIGFYCTLKNDNFTMSGKTVRGDTEYFVKGVRIGPQINVVNRNPGQTISFKSMLERVNRIGSKGETDQW